MRRWKALLLLLISAFQTVTIAYPEKIFYNLFEFAVKPSNELAGILAWKVSRRCSRTQQALNCQVTTGYPLGRGVVSWSLVVELVVLLKRKVFTMVVLWIHAVSYTKESTANRIYTFIRFFIYMQYIICHLSFNLRDKIKNCFDPKWTWMRAVPFDLSMYH